MNFAWTDNVVSDTPHKARTLLDLLLPTVAALVISGRPLDDEENRTLRVVQEALTRWIKGVGRGRPGWDEALVKDILQEFWLRLLTRKVMKGYDQTRGSTQTQYLLGVLRYVILEVVRRRNRDWHRSLDMYEVADDITCRDSSTFEYDADDVQRALDTLPESLRRTVEAIYFGDEAGYLKSITPSARYGRMHRAKGLLKQALISRQ